MLLSGELNAHLEEIDHAAEELLFQLVEQMAECEGINEQLKAQDEMKWIGAMNDVRERAEELIYSDMIYAI